jgi:chromosome segregation ATPase
MKSRPVSVNVTANGLAANQAQQTANQAVTSANKYKMAWDEANSETIAALDEAQKEFESNLAWVKSQIYEGQHQNDSAVASLRSDMESSWNSMSTVEESLYNSAITATSEVDSHLESLRVQNSLSLADLHSTANSLHDADTSLHADAESMRGSLADVASGLGKNIATTRDSLAAVDDSLHTATSETASELASTRDSLVAVDSDMRGGITQTRSDLATVRDSLKTATSEVANNLTNARNSLTAVDNDLRNGVKQASNDLSVAKTSLAATGNSLATATSELQRQTGQLSGSLSTANSMIMFNSNAIAEVKHTAEEISTTVSNIRVGGRNLLTNTRTLSGIWNGATETVDGFTVAKMTKTVGNWQDIVAWNGLTNIKPNTDYVLTFYAKASKQTRICSYLYNIGTDTVYADGSTPNTLTTDYQRFTVHFHTDAMPAGRKVNCLPVRVYDNVTVWVYGCQLEEGNTATQWQPNPDDTDQAISKVSQTADAIRADLTNTKGDVASVKATANSLQSQITDNKNNISSVKQTADSLTSTVGRMPAQWQQAINDKASAQVLTSNVDMNNLTTAGTYLIKDFSAKNAPISAWFMATVEATADRLRVVQRVKKDDANVAYERSNNKSGWTEWERVATGTDVSSIKQTMDSITTRVSNAEGNVSSLQQTASKLQSDLTNAKGDISSLQQTANGLTSRVGSAEGNISQLQQTANGLTSTVSNLHSGDRNYARNTFNKWQTLTGFTGATNYCTPDLGIFYPDDLQVGDTVTIGYTIKNSGIQSGKFQLQGPGNVTVWNAGSIGSPSYDISKVCPDGATTTLVQYLTLTADNLKNSKFNFRIRTDNFPAGTLSYKGLFVKKGNLATDWSPAPEDVNASISQIKQTADQIQAQVTSAKGDISSVTQTANAVKTDLVNTKGDVAAVKATADSLTAQMADANGNISQLQQTAKGLQSSVTDQSGKLSKLQQDADGLTVTVANGGQNLLRDSDTIPNWHGDTEKVDQFTVVKAKKNFDGDYDPIAWNGLTTIKPNTDYTLSFWAKADQPAKIFSFLYNICPDNGYSDGFTTTQLTTNYQRFEIHFHTQNFTAGSRTVNCLPMRINAKNVTHYIYGCKLEEGAMATAWSPSPGDIAQLKITADGLTSKVADTQGNVSKLQQTANSLQTQMTNTQKDVSSLKVTAGEISADLTNAKGDIARVKTTADSLTTSMTNAQNDISTLQHTATSITSTLSNGGVNLLSGTSDFSWGIVGWNGNPPHSIIDDGESLKDYKISLVAGASNQGFWWSGNNTLNQTYTLSFDAKSDNGKAKINIMGLEGNFLEDAPLTTDWVRYHISGKVTAGSHNWVTYFSTTDVDTVYVRKYQIEYGDTATPWKPSNGDISSLQQTAQGLTADMKDAKGNISSLQTTASQFTTSLQDTEKNVSSLQVTAKELDTQIKAVDGRASSIKETADGINARVSKIEGNNVVGSLLKLDGNEAGLGTYVNNKLIAGINTNPDGVTIDGKNIHLNGQTHIDDGVINASKITVYNTVGDNKGNQYLSAAWGQLNSTIGGKDDQGNSLWGSINQTNGKLTSYYQELKNDGSSTRSLIQQKADDILLAVDQKVQYSTYTVSASSPWDFDYTKSIYGNWFINGETSGNYFYNGPDGLKPWVYVQSRGSADGTRFVVTVWRDYDPTQYQRTWTGDHWTPWVMLPNSSNLVSAINLSPDGVTIDGKNIELNGNTTIHGQLNLLPTDQRYVDQRVQGFHNPWAWRDANVFAGSGGLQLRSTIVSQSYSNDNTSIYGLRGGSSAAITTLAPTYLKFTVYPSWNDVNNGFTNQLARTYIDAGRIETNDVWAGDFRLTGSKMRGLNGSLYVTNWNGTNFDNAGAVGFQVWSGIGLGKSTIYTPTSDLYVQIGNVGPLLGQSYSDAGKVDVHCNRVISQRANTVSSRLSVKTAITKVTYDRALMAVQNTDMYDYRYTSDETGQHYVSGIIDDIHDKPEYNMDPMLINKERTARIDANLLGYHQVVLQEILKRLDKLEAK